MKHDPKATANALSLVTALVFVFCRLAFALLPDLSLLVGQSWFHGIEVSQLSGSSLTLGSFVLGLLTATIGAWLVGYLFAYLYNLFVKEGCGEKGCCH